MGANGVFTVFMVLRQRLEEMMRLQELQRIVSDPLKLMEILTGYEAAQTQHPHEAN